MLIRDIECIRCKKMIECIGHPSEIKRCIDFEEREENAVCGMQKGNENTAPSSIWEK